MEDKKEFLTAFDEFLNREHPGAKCYFRSLAGEEHQGWIDSIYYDGDFSFWESGPWAGDDPLRMSVADVDIRTLAYYDEESLNWKGY